MKLLPLTIFNLIVEIGAVQGIVLGLVLYFLPAKDNSKRYFSFILFTLALLSFKILLHTLGLWNLALFHLFPLAIDTTLPPLLYLYISSITANEITGRRALSYFIPTILFMLYAVLIYAWALTIKDFAHKDLLANAMFFNQIKAIEDFVAVISGIVYWLFGFKRITRYRIWLFDTQSDSRLQEFTWLKNVLLISAIMLFGLTIVVLLEDILTVGKDYFLALEIFYVYLALSTYYLSLKGYALFSLSKHADSTADQMPLPRFSDMVPNEHLLQVPSVKGDYLVVKEAILHSLHDDKIYLNPHLNIKQMAQHVGYPVTVVSAAINQEFGLNFRNLVNQYRVEEFKERSVNAPSHLSLFGIALECGFNSEASFFRIFRQGAGLSPNDYIQKVKS